MEQLVYIPSPVAISVLLALMMLSSWRIGVRLGRGLQAKGRGAPQFETASTALLTLLLALAFGASVAKYDQRRIAILQDSNAIGDFYTCASLLKEPLRGKLQNVIREYARKRIDLARQPQATLNLEKALIDFQRSHMQMTDLVYQAITAGTPISVSITNTLNAVTSNQAARLAAFRDRLPSSIVSLLFLSTVLTALLIGRNQGFSQVADFSGAICFVLMVGFATYVILDLNSPQSGLIRVSQEPIERLISSLTK